MNSPSTPQAKPRSTTPVWLELVREKVEGVRYGVIELIVHDGQVTQIETTEKTRIPPTRD